MENFKINAARDTLDIVCDSKTGIIEMKGISYPEDAAEFFNPIFDWLENYIQLFDSKIILNLRIHYLNTSSTKCLFDLIDRMEEYCETGGDARINWYYERNDEDIKETGLEFKEDITLPFDMIPY